MIKQITIKDIEPYMNAAKKENLIFSAGVEYFGKFIDNKLVGWVGLKTYPNKYVLKADYVLKKYRGKNIFNELDEYRRTIVRTSGAFKPVEAYCTKRIVSYHLHRGAKVVKEYKISTKIKYEDIY